MSGYSPKDNPTTISLQHLDETIQLNFPTHDLYSADMQYEVKPNSTQQIWAYYESRSVTMTNLIQTPLVIKDTNNRRKSIRAEIPRHAEQIKMHREAASLW